MAEQKNTYMSLSFNDIPLEKALEIRDAVIQMGGATNLTVYFDEPIENDTQPDDECDCPAHSYSTRECTCYCVHGNSR